MISDPWGEQVRPSGWGGQQCTFCRWKICHGSEVIQRERVADSEWWTAAAG